MYRSTKKKYVRRGTIAAVASFVAVTAIGLSSTLHRSDGVAAAMKPSLSGPEISTAAVAATSSTPNTESRVSVAKFHLVASSDEGSTSGISEN